MLASLIMVAAFWPPYIMQLCSPDEKTNILGIAQSPSGEFLYCENIDISSEQNLNISYMKDGKRFAVKKITGTSNHTMPSIEQVDLRSGETRVAALDHQMLSMQYQASRKEKMQSTQIALSDVDVVDAGFDYFIRDHWNALQAGQVLSVNFASIAHQKVLPLRVRELEAQKCAEKNESTQPPYCYFVEIDNALLRLVLGNIKLGYDEQRRLINFNGVVNIEDEKGSTQTAHIRYYYKAD